MTTQIYLIAPTDAEPAAFAARLKAVLAASPVSALLVPRGTLAENAYKTLVKTVLPVAQAEGCAVLIEGEPGLVRLLGADGLHVSGPAKAVKDAVAALKPNNLIVGAGPAETRHDAMTLGEMDPDYVMFGPLTGAPTPEMRDMASWWSETMEIPAVLSDTASGVEAIDPAGCEFIALSANVWAEASPETAIAAFGKRLETI